jgi:hypothetical protein
MVPLGVPGDANDGGQCFHNFVWFGWHCQTLAGFVPCRELVSG